VTVINRFTSLNA